MPTDNTNLGAKLDLRRFMIRKHFGERSIRVFDACQGQGAIWAQLKRELNVVRYWGVDLKPEKGRLKADSSRILSQGLKDYDVIDIDTYGSPWRHWLALLPNVVNPMVVFLTVGVGGPRQATDKAVINALGLQDLHIPSQVLIGKLSNIGIRYCLAEAYNYGLDLLDAVEVMPSKNARYLAAYIRPVPRDAQAKD